MTWIIAYLTIAGLFAMLGVSTGGFQRRDELAGDIIACVFWPASITIALYTWTRAWMTKWWPR